MPQDLQLLASCCPSLTLRDGLYSTVGNNFFRRPLYPPLLTRRSDYNPSCCDVGTSGILWLMGISKRRAPTAGPARVVDCPGDLFCACIGLNLYWRSCVNAGPDHHPTQNQEKDKNHYTPFLGLGRRDGVREVSPEGCGVVWCAVVLWCAAVWSKRRPGGIT